MALTFSVHLQMSDLAAVAVVGRFQGPAVQVEHLDVAHVGPAKDKLK